MGLDDPEDEFVLDIDGGVTSIMYGEDSTEKQLVVVTVVALLVFPEPWEIS